MTFPLAPMSRVIRVLTVLLLLLPAAFAMLAGMSPQPAATILLASSLAMALLFAGAWLRSRPSGFEVGGDGLTILWPIRRRTIPQSALLGVRRTDPTAFKEEFGMAVRIGIGGLWGVFGWLWTTRGGLVDVYISRTDGWVLVEIEGKRPLLITPERPDELVATLGY